MTATVSKAPKDTFFLKKSMVNCRGKLLNLDEPLIMGILNATPDSFFDGGQLDSRESVLNKARELIKGGANIIDIGGYSTRPGAKDIGAEEEWKRVQPVLRQLREAFPEIIISIDTFRSEIAKKAVETGADMINDISGGGFDPEMFQTVASLNVPYVLMHIKGSPETMQKAPQYDNIIDELHLYFSKKIQRLRKLGVNDIILDPGFGFGKTTEHNFLLLKHLEEYRIFGCPILAGVSRKSMINKVLKTKPENALNGTTVINTLALLNGANILRVHDAREAWEVKKLMKYYRSIK